MFAISIIIKLSWIVLQFQNAESNGKMMCYTKIPPHQQGRHTNVVKTFGADDLIYFLYKSFLVALSPS